MKSIPSSSLLSHVKREARSLVKKKGLRHMEALELLAKEKGYKNWHELQTQSHAFADRPPLTVFALDAEEFEEFTGPSSGNAPFNLVEWVEGRWVKDIRPWDTERPALQDYERAYIRSELALVGYDGDDRPKTLDEALALFMRHSRWAPWYVWVDGVFHDLTDEKGAGYEEDEKLLENPFVRRMLEWFLERYKDPADGVPYESAAGGYQYIFGGPYDPEEEISAEFPHAPFRYLQAATKKLYLETGTEWVKVDQY